MRTLLRRNSRVFLLATLAGLALRLLFLFSCSRVTDDSHFYADIAKNWLQHGVYGLTDNGVIIPTLTRLPGYPAFLAVVFAIFGADHYRAVFVIQIFVDMATCLVIADIARRTISDRAAKTAFLLSALCPFLANYASVALTETLEVFFTALALDCAVTGLAALRDPSSGGTVPTPIVYSIVHSVDRLRRSHWRGHPAPARRRHPSRCARLLPCRCHHSKLEAQADLPAH